MLDLQECTWEMFLANGDKTIRVVAFTCSCVLSCAGLDWNRSANGKTIRVVAMTCSCAFSCAGVDSNRSANGTESAARLFLVCATESSQALYLAR